MLARIRKAQQEREGGFTLIELLVVIIIIGILAAIAIPTFLRQREKGWNAASKSELRNAAVAQESFYTESDTYTTTLADLEAEGFNASSDVTLTLTSGDTAGYCMSAVHVSGGDTWYLGSDGGEANTTGC
jgi:type IV pilus assembly protein PilA